MKKIDINELDLLNVYRDFHFKWALISVDDGIEKNSMTISWGELGSLWNLPVCTVFVRPQRYTFSLINKIKYFTIQFFDEEYKNELKYFGSTSKYDEDKIANSKLEVVNLNKGFTFKEAKLTLVCEILYKDYIKDENFIDEDVNKKVYPYKDYHQFYIGKIIEIYEK